MSTMKTVGDTEGYGSASTPDSVTEKAPTRKRQSERSLERQATSIVGKECDRDVSSHTAIQYLRRQHNERGFGRIGE